MITCGHIYYWKEVFVVSIEGPRCPRLFKDPTIQDVPYSTGDGLPAIGENSYESIGLGGEGVIPREDGTSPPPQTQG